MDGPRKMFRLGVARRCYSTGRSLVIDGKVCGSSDGSRIGVYSPINDEKIADLDEATVEDASMAVKSLKRPKNGKELLTKAAAFVRESSEELARLETRDCGKPIRETRADIEYCADIFEYYAQREADDEVLNENYGFKAKRIVSPRGNCVLITPWNYPLMQAVLKIAPAIANGNACILKPSPLASLTCVELCSKVDWEGSLQLITGNTRAAEALVEHRDISFVSFTGSEGTGRHIMKACATAQPLRPVALELGGKSALIIRHDADLDLALDLSLQGILPAAGQICSATSRILVHSSIAQEFIEKLAHRLSIVQIGIDPLSEDCEFGPVISRERQSYIEDIVDQDSNTLTFRSEKTNAPGYWVRPALFTQVNTESTLWQDELFGPVLALRTFESDQEAIQVANATRYGLSAALVSRDTDGMATSLLSQLEAGVLWLNTNQLLWPDTPFGGMRSSGFGWEGGLAGLHEYAQYRTLIYPSASSQ